MFLYINIEDSRSKLESINNISNILDNKNGVLL